MPETSKKQSFSIPAAAASTTKPNNQPITNAEGPSHRRSSLVDWLLKKIPLTNDSKKDSIPLESALVDYKICKELGRGTWGKVMKAIHLKTNTIVALKFIHHEKFKNEKERFNCEREIKITGELDHVNVVKMYSVIREPELTVLVLEYVCGQELLYYVLSRKRLSEKEALNIFRQLLSAIEYCHSQGIIHRDIKPENVIVMKNGQVKLIDFGLSKHITPGELFKTYCGSFHYSSPEILLKKPYIGPEVDVWSLGVILYTMITGHIPWKGRNEFEQFNFAINGEYYKKFAMKPEIEMIIRDCLEVNPKQRASVLDITLLPIIRNGQ